ncbi:MAG: hypothetical protein AB1633_05245 [Elusimicrobiota bacterium]
MDSKQREILTKYMCDLSKICFTVRGLNQIVEHFNLVLFTIGITITVVLLIFGIMLSGGKGKCVPSKGY